MGYTRIKICGITSADDAEACVVAGVDAIGMVFYEASPRAVNNRQAVDIVRRVGPFVTTVALFVNPEISLVEEVIETVKPSLLQFHGDEAESFCTRFNHPFIKAVRVRPGTDLQAQAANYTEARGLLFDAWNPNLYGGTGETFDWHRLQAVENLPVILAGGLSPDNVEEAVRVASPYAVDVSGGVEISKGVKDPVKINQFVAAVRRAGGKTD